MLNGKSHPKMRSKNFRFSTMEFLGFFSWICPFLGLFNGYRAKTTWETHPTGFLSPKRGFGALFSIILKNHGLSKNDFSIFQWFFEKKFQNALNTLFLAQKYSWMGFPCGFSSKLMEKSQKWFLEKVYRKCVKM